LYADEIEGAASTFSQPSSIQCCRKVCQRGKSLLADHLEEALYKKSAKGLPQAT